MCLSNRHHLIIRLAILKFQGLFTLTPLIWYTLLFPLCCLKLILQHENSLLLLQSTLKLIFVLFAKAVHGLGQSGDLEVLGL